MSCTVWGKWNVSRVIPRLLFWYEYSHKKRRDGSETWVWKHGPYCWYFHLNLKYLGWPYRAYIKTAKNGDYCEELLSESEFGVIWATFCCCDHRTKASEAAQRIATDQKESRKCSSFVIICWIAKIYLSINNSEKWLQVTRIPSTQLKSCWSCTEKKSNNRPMVSFIHNRSKIITWMGYNFKNKRTKYAAAFLR